MSNASETPIGQNEAAVTVSRSVAKPVKEVWRVLMTKEGAECLLGPGAQFGDKGHTWTSESGRTGVMRSLHPLEQIRFSYRKDETATPSVVELELTPDGESDTRLQVTHSNLLPRTDLNELEQRWSDALDRLATCVTAQ
jgi:uncharacterized protein YndB with AHSA1/START domain